MNPDMLQSVDTSDTKFDESQGDLEINNLIYEMPRALSLATGRTHIAQYSERNTYTVDRNSTMVWNWNTGNAFVDCANSYLRFKMKAINPSAVASPQFGVGSALNLFHEIRIRSRSGTELSRLENCNLHNNYRLRYTKTTNWLSTIGSSFLVNNAFDIFNAANTLQTEVVIPLSELDSFFRPLKGNLIPPQLASGLRIELSLESIAKAFLDPLGFFQAGSSLELVDIAMMLDTVSLSDETSKILNLESSQSGLEYCYPRVYNYASTYNAGTSNFTVQVSKAVSQATHVYLVTQSAGVTNNPLVDSFVSEDFKYKNFQFRLGSAYYPNQVVISQTQNATIKGKEAYLLALSSFDKMKSVFQETSVTPVQYAGTACVLATSLERNQSLAVSGLPINNSRLLEVLVERDSFADAGVARDVNVFLSYVTVAKAYIDNVSVAI